MIQIMIITTPTVANIMITIMIIITLTIINVETYDVLIVTTKQSARNHI
jgi:hypothetical protein